MPAEIKPLYAHMAYPNNRLNPTTPKEVIKRLTDHKRHFAIPTVDAYPMNSALKTAQLAYGVGAQLNHFIVAVVCQNYEKTREGIILRDGLHFMEDYQILYSIKFFRENEDKQLINLSQIEKEEKQLLPTPMYKELFDALRPRSGPIEIQKVVAAIQKLYQISKTTGEFFRDGLFGKFFNNNKKNLIAKLDNTLKENPTLTGIKKVLSEAEFKSTENQLLTQAILIIIDFSSRRPIPAERATARQALRSK